jgi:hypothetical protein
VIPWATVNQTLLVCFEEVATAIFLPVVHEAWSPGPGLDDPAELSLCKKHGFSFSNDPHYHCLQTEHRAAAVAGGRAMKARANAKYELAFCTALQTPISKVK